MILDASAFGIASAPPATSEGLCHAPDLLGAKLVHDADGLAVPTFWHPNVKKWEKQPLAWRKRMSLDHLEKLAKEAQKALQPERPRRPFATRFTTDYAIKWGRKQKSPGGKKWSLIDRESYDYRLKRHHDCEGMVDAIFDDQDTGRVGIQGAGKGERSAHYQKFLQWGGPDKARRRNLRVLYLEFERGSFDPIFYEEWA